LLLAAETLTDDELTIGFVAIVLVTLLGIILVAMVVVGARQVRRLNRRPTPPSQMASDRWYEKPLIDPTAPSPDEEPSDAE
jgi:hypothetical protein